MTAWSFLEVNLFPSMDVEKENERIGDLIKKVNSDWKSQPDIEEGYIYDLKLKYGGGGYSGGVAVYLSV